jgi:DNA-binding NarL/FixJ family response regulator
MKLLIVDDHHLFLEGMVSLLTTEKSFATVDTATGGMEALEKINNTHYDVVLLDIGMPGMDGLQTLKEIKSRSADVKVIILTTYNDKAIFRELIENGISGYVLKNSTKKELIEAIKKVGNGHMYFSEDIHDIVVHAYSTYLLAKNQSNGDKIAFTQREKEVLMLLAREYTNEAIAEELKISFRTVETHRKNMMQKTKSHNLAGLLKYAYREGLIA